jgi:hypothetical protein
VGYDWPQVQVFSARRANKTDAGTSERPKATENQIAGMQQLRRVGRGITVTVDWSQLISEHDFLLFFEPAWIGSTLLNFDPVFDGPDPF